MRSRSMPTKSAMSQFQDGPNLQADPISIVQLSALEW
jgi:hypothetical protein